MRKPLAKKSSVGKALAQVPDEQIDFSDIPEIRELPSDRVIGRFYRPRKTAVTIRLDSDVLAWLEAFGGGYQTRINDYLRQRMRRNRSARTVPERLS
jgi:uncharacterized protein (DUF4415 family)